MASDNNGNDDASGDDTKQEDHTAGDLWSSWGPPQDNVTPTEMGSNYELVNQPIPNLPDDVASVLCTDTSFLTQSALTDDSLSMSFGSLSVVCSSALNIESNSWKENDPVLSLSDAINTSDDIKSNNSCLSFGSSVARGTGAVSKKTGGALSQKVSKCGIAEKCLKISSKSPGSQPETGESSEDAVSPSTSAPPPPPPTPNVLSGDASHDPDLLPPTQGHHSGAQCLSSLSSWPTGGSLAASIKKPCGGIVSSKPSIIPPMKDGVKSSNLMSLLSSAATESNTDSIEAVFVAAGAVQGSSYISTRETLDVTSTHESSPSNMASVKPIPAERCSSLVPRSNISSSGLAAALPVSSVGTVHPVSVSLCSGTSTGSTPHLSLMSSSSSTASSSLSSNVGTDHVTSSSNSGNEVMPLRAVGADLHNLPAPVVEPADLHHQHHLSHQLQQQRVTVHNAKAGPMYNWQATLTTVKERFAFLFNNEILSDVQFVVGRGEEEQVIPAHKFVLAVGSAVFDAMFNGQLASQQQIIHLPDVEPQAFLALLSFLYSDEVQIGPETVMTVLYTAKKYAVPALERRCVDFLKTNLSSDNAFMLLTQARLFDEPQLAALCLKTIDKCTAEAIVAEGFTDIDHETLTQVLQRDTLRIKELHLFRAVCRWAEAECGRQGCGQSGRQQRSVLGHALKLIRFPLMSVEEFAQGPAQSGILTDAEVVQLFLYFSVNPKPSVDFIDVPRCCMTGKEQTVCRFQSIEARWGYSGTPDRIRFIVDRRIFVVGFGMYGSIHGPSEYEVIVQLIHTLTGKVCGSNETVFTSDGSMNTFRVMFPDPIEVLPNTNYTAYATLKGPDSHYGTKGLRKVVVECPSGDRVCFQFSYAAGNNNGTSVEDGQIPEIIFHT